MWLEDRSDGDYRIYAGSIELRIGHGFLAAVIVCRVDGSNRTKVDVHRDIAISGGHAWLTSSQAIEQAFLRGTRFANEDRIRLARLLLPGAVP